MDDGIWTFTVNTGTPKTGCVWSRAAAGGGRIETWVSASTDALLLSANASLTKTGNSFSTKAAFLAWACQQLGGGTLKVWDIQSNVQTSNHSCS